MVRAPHALAAEVVARKLAGDLERGLSEAEADARLVRFGPNRLPRARRPAYATIALRQFADPLVGLLIGATLVSFLVGESIEAAAIAAIVLLNAALGFVQEARAESAVLALRDVLEEHTNVVRGGREREVAVEQLVPGDLVLLREGERVPADARLVDAAALAVDESTLTGESVPVDKADEAVPTETPLAERTSMAFAGSSVTRGRGRGIVTATGAATELGEIADLAQQAKQPLTPLQRRIGALTRLMVAFGVVVTLALGGAMLARGSSLEDAFLVGVSVAVAAVPEGLAATVTIALALGAREMASRGAIVRRLTAVETLGSATVIASDKTGTLTENRLRLAEALPANGRGELELLTAAVLASTARLIGEEGQLEPVGDPVDAALVLAAHERGPRRPDAARGEAARARAAVRSRAQAHGARVRAGRRCPPVREGRTRGRAGALDDAGRRVHLDPGGRGGVGFQGPQGACRRRAPAFRDVRRWGRSRARAHRRRARRAARSLARVGTRRGRRGALRRPTRRDDHGRPSAHRGSDRTRARSTRVRDPRARDACRQAAPGRVVAGRA